MTPLAFLVRRQLLNFLKGQLKKPVLLIVYVLGLAIVVFSVIVSRDVNTAAAMPEGALSASVLIVFTGLMYMNLRNGLSRGATVFGMEDVNFLFTSPVHRQSVLVYGVLRQAGVSMIIIFVLLFQIANLRNMFAMTVPGIIVLMLGVFLVIMLSQVISMCLYSVLAAKEGANKKAEIALNVLAVAFIVAAGLMIRKNPTLEGAIELFSSHMWRLIPISGWLSGAVVEANAGVGLSATGYIALCLLLGLCVILAVRRVDPDYYEDVLDITLENHEKRQASKDLNAKANAMSRRGAKAGKSGLSRGYGASAFFFKQLREQRREGPLLLDMRTLMLAVTAGIICVPIALSMRDDGGDMSFVIYVVLGALLYVQLIFNATSGRFTQEQLKPYLFLAPCSPRMKLIMCNLIPAMKGAVDGLICCVGVSAVLGLSLSQAIAAGLIVGVATLFFTAAGLVADWLVGDKHSRVLGTMLYFISVFVLMVPGVIAFGGFTIIMPQFPLIAYFAGALYLCVVITLLFALLGGILHNVETVI